VTDPAASRRAFVLHEHRRPRHHFDLRLEERGVLRSWALPRGLPVSPEENRLAIEVADHDLDHLTYQDTDKSIADHGWWEEHDRNERGSCSHCTARKARTVTRSFARPATGCCISPGISRWLESRSRGMVVVPEAVRSSLATDLDALTRPVWIRRGRRPVQPEQARSVWSRPDRRRAPGYGSGGWGFGSQPGSAPAPPGGTTTVTRSQPASIGPT
jgi:hypothetical protein